MVYQYLNNAELSRVALDTENVDNLSFTSWVTPKRVAALERLRHSYPEPEKAMKILLQYNSNRLSDGHGLIGACCRILIALSSVCSEPMRLYFSPFQIAMMKPEILSRVAEIEKLCNAQVEPIFAYNTELKLYI